MKTLPPWRGSDRGGAEERGSKGEKDEKRDEESVLFLFVSPSSLFLFSSAPLLPCSLSPLPLCSPSVSSSPGGRDLTSKAIAKL